MSTYLSDLSDISLCYSDMSTYLSDLSDISLGYPDMSAYLSDLTIIFLATYISVVFCISNNRGGGGGLGSIAIYISKHISVT